ncbi:MAG: hypothetical protein ABI772_12750 [Bacteroidota bacterium]
MNRQPWLYILIVFITSCATNRNVPVAPPVVNAPPVKKDSVVVAKAEVKKPEKKIFHLQLLLSLNAAHYLENDSSGGALHLDMESLNLSSLHLYEGMQLAAEQGDSSLVISVNDAGSDSLRAMKFLKDKNQKDNDLVISMISPSLNATAAVASTDAEYPLVITQHITSSVLFGNKNAWLASPSNKTQCRQMASYVQLKQPSAVYRFIYRSDNKKETDLADLFYSEMISLGVDSGNCKKINYNTDGWNLIQKNWKAGKKNVLFIPISDESILTSLLKKIDTHDASEVMIIGLPTWEFFETMDFSLLENLNTHLFSSSYIDYEDENVKAFRKRFVETYHADPLPSAFTGYDYYNWVSGNFNKHGNKIADFESIPNLTSPTSGFRFKRVCDNCGWENQYISVLKFQEGVLVKVNK